MSRFLEKLPPTDSPWGSCQTAEEHAPGIWHVTTPSHGGYILTPERNAELPEAARDDAAVYEEDVDWAIIGWFFRAQLREHDPNFPVERAREILLNWHPDIYECLTGDVPSPEHSFILKRRRQITEAIGKEVVTSACRPRHADIPADQVIVTTRRITGLGRDDLPEFDPGFTREWLVSADDYAQRGALFTPVNTFTTATPHARP